MIYKFYINNTLVDNPDGWETTTTSFDRDRLIKAVLKKQEGTYEFKDSGFDLIFSLYKTYSWNYSADIVIKRSTDGMTFKDFLVGTIPLSDVDFSMKLKSVKCKILDNSYQAKINGSKNVGAFLFASRSRLNKTIAPITPVELSFFKPSDGIYYSITSTGGYENLTYRVYDIFRFLIDFVTDGTVDFISDTFGPTGQYYNYFITTGRILEMVDSAQADWDGVDQAEWEASWEKVSYQLLFTEINNRFNITFNVEPTGSPTIRIEADEFSRNTDRIFTKTDVAALNIKTLTDYLFSKVKFGQGETDNGAAWQFPEDTPFNGFQSEEFPITLNNPFDKTLDISCNWISSSNVIEKMIIDGLLNDRSYDKKIFIIEGESDGGAGFQAKASNPFTGTVPYFYNQSLTNNKIAERYFGGIPATIATYIDTATVNAKAVNTAYSQKEITGASNILTPTFQEYEPVQFSDDYAQGYDTSNGFGNGTAQGSPVSQANSRYTAATGGVLTFNILHKVNVTNFTQVFNFSTLGARLNNVYLYASVKRYDSSNNFISSAIGRYVKLLSNSTVTLPANTPGTYELPCSATFTANSGDYFQVSVTAVYLPSGFNVMNTLHFYRNGSGSRFLVDKVNQLAMIQVYETGNYPVVLFDSQSVPMTEDEFETILLNPNGEINIGMDGEKSYFGNVESIKFKHEKKECQMLLSGTHTKNF